MAGGLLLIGVVVLLALVEAGVLLNGRAGLVLLVPALAIAAPGMWLLGLFDE